MIVIRGAQLYDPARGFQPLAGDLWVDGEQIVSPPGKPATVDVIDARGKIVAPAGIEIHTHVAGFPLNLARRFLLGSAAEMERLLPTPRQAAERYLRMGYTTVLDAATSPLYARHAHADLDQMAPLDCGTFIQVGDYHLLLKALADGDFSFVRDLLAWLVSRSGGYAIKLVNPGGGFAWRNGIGDPGLDDAIGMADLTQRKILSRLVNLVEQIGMPHPVHLHACHLGQPGNARDFCATVQTLDGMRCHLCHIQFYAYGHHPGGGYASAAEAVVERIARQNDLTFDIGQVMFGSAMGITHDTCALSALQRATGGHWISNQVEGEGGNNVLPLTYSGQDPTGAVQWATGLELLLRFPDPYRLYLTTDHPNGASFDAYPQIIAWLMDRSQRLQVLKRIHPAAARRTGLAGIMREYSLGEVFAMTSLGPARALGLLDRGTLQPGSLADLRCYTPSSDFCRMFAQPDWVMRRGQIVLRDGQLTPVGSGTRLIVKPHYDLDRVPRVERRLAELVSLDADAYTPDLDGAVATQEVPCG